MKIAVYTIALNEEQHVDRWVNSVKEADYLIVADTGSSDKTIELLELHGVVVHKISIDPWRFDTARNAALSLVPQDADICISMDMDEYMGDNWRSLLEESWIPNVTTRINYTYYYDAEMGHSFYADKIHARHGYEWRRPVHETVYSISGDEIVATVPNLIMNQKQDYNKSRSNYLPLLEISHRENPTDSQTLFWLCRDLYYSGDLNRADTKLREYLNLHTSKWPIERTEAMRYLSVTNPDKCEYWLLKALTECDYRREIWLDLAKLYYNSNDWINCYWACENAIKRCYHCGSYLDDPSSWGPKVWDIGSIAAYWLGLTSRAVEMVQQAIMIDPNDSRLTQNLEFIQKGQST